jgi:hypothetical protein
MRRSLNTYTAYSMGCAIVWAIILVGVTFESSKDTAHTIYLVCLGWVIGWLSASIARLVYPPTQIAVAKIS